MKSSLSNVSLGASSPSEPTESALFTDTSYETTELRLASLRIQVNRWGYFCLAATFTLVILAVSAAFDLAIDIALIPLYTYDICYAGLLLKQLSAETSAQTSATINIASLQKDLVSCAMSLSFKVMIPFRHLGNPSQTLVVPLVIAILFKVLYKGCVDQEIQLVVGIAKVAYQLCKIVTVLNVGLKLDNEVLWDWETVFWPVWGFLSITSLFAIGTFLQMCVISVTWLLQDAKKTDVLWSAWVTFSIINFVLSFGVFFLEIGVMLQTDEYYAWPFAVPLIFTVYFVATSSCIDEVAL